MALIGEGVLGPGASEYFDIAMRGGIQHRIYVRPEEPGVDFDLYIFDENGNLVTEDISTASDAYCVITPRWSGPFRLVVKSARGLSRYNIVVDA